MSKPSAPNLFPKSPEEKLVDALFIKKSTVANIDDQTRNSISEEGADGMNVEFRPYLLPCEPDEAMKVHYKQMHLEPQEDFSLDVREAFVRFPDDQDVDWFSDTFLEVHYKDGYPTERYLVNFSGAVLYDTADQVIENSEHPELETSTGDRFSVLPEFARPGRRGPKELLAALEDAVTLTQEPAA